MTKIQLKQLMHIQAMFLIILLFVLIVLIPPVAATPTGVFFDSSDYGLGDTAFVEADDDCVGLSPGLTNTADVHITSTNDPTGVTLTLPQTLADQGDCRFGSALPLDHTTGSIIFTNSSEIPLLSSIQININDPNGFNGPAFVTISSTTVPNGFQLPLSGDAGQFSGRFMVGTSDSSLPAIDAQPGDEVKIDYYGEKSSFLVGPNPYSSVGMLRASFNDVLTATYGTVSSAPSTIDLSLTGGGGGGGAIVVRPGFVLDAILTPVHGGGPYIVSPPSFGGRYFPYSDGLTITQGSTKTIFDTSKYNQDIPKQVMVSGEKVNMDFKTFEAYNPTGVIHMGLYLIPRGEDMITSNSIASIVYDKNSPVQINDPNHILSDASASSISDGTFQHTQFSFVPTKSYNEMSFLARAWNDHMYATDVRIHDGVVTPPAPKILPAGIVMYENFNDLQVALEKDQFYKPEIMAHIHSTTDMFPSNDGGHVYWLYDSIAHTITLVISDENENTLYYFTQPLIEKEIQQKGDDGFMKFIAKQVNSWNHDNEQKTMEQEAIKAMEKILMTGGYHQENGVWTK